MGKCYSAKCLLRRSSFGYEGWKFATKHEKAGKSFPSTEFTLSESRMGSGQVF